MVSQLTQTPVFKLSRTALLFTLLAGLTFITARYYHLTQQGKAFAYDFELGRMLINFGGMALLSPLIYKVVDVSLKFNKLKVGIWLIGLILFAYAYKLLNEVVLSVFYGMGEVSFFSFNKKLFLNFAHLLVLFYGAIAYASYRLIRRQDQINKNNRKSIHLKIDGVQQYLSLDEISHIITNDHYLKIYLSDGKFKLVRHSLKNIIPKLSADFVQVHRSTVVNRNAVQSLSKNQGKHFVVLTDGNRLKVSDGYLANLSKLGVHS